MRTYVMQQQISNIIMLLLTFSISVAAHAHSPHDEVYGLGISPDYANDRTLFLSTDGELTGFRYPDVLRSTDGGATWTLLPNGMDNRTTVSAIRVSPGYKNDSTVFVAAGNGVYKSSNRGDLWEPFSSGLVNHFAVTMEIAGAENNYVLFLAVGDGRLYRRTHLQTEWVEVLSKSAADVNVIAPSPNFSQDETVVVANSNGEIKISTDGGLSWVDKGNPTSATIYDIAIAPGDNREIILATSDGIFVSSDLGSSFTAHQSNLPAEAINNIAFSPNFPVDHTVFCTTLTKATYKSTDNGVNWVFHETGARITGQTAPPKEFRELQVSKTFAADQTIFLSAFDGFFISTNGGSEWSQKQTRESLINGLALSPNFINDGTVIASIYFGGTLYTSTSKGATWLPERTGWPIGATIFYDVDFVRNHPGPPLAFAIATKTYIGSTNDFGKNWNALPTLQPTDTGEVYSNVMALSPNFDNDRQIYLGTRAHGVIQTSDGGINWHQVPDVPHSPHITSVAVSPNYASDKIAFAANRMAEVWRTQNGGGTWSRVGIDSIVKQGAQSYMWIAFSPQFASDNLVLVGTDNGIYRSNNGGDSWEPFLHADIGAGTVIQQIEFSPAFGQDRSVFVNVRGKGLYRVLLTNEGEETSVENFGVSLLGANVQFTEFRFSPNFDQDSTILGASRRNVYISTDGGLTWGVSGSPGSQ